MIFGKLLCRWKGHLRGKVIEKTQTQRVTACPRCGAQRVYAVRSPKLKAVA